MSHTINEKQQKSHRCIALRVGILLNHYNKKLSEEQTLNTIFDRLLKDVEATAMKKYEMKHSNKFIERAIEVSRKNIFIFREALSYGFGNKEAIFSNLKELYTSQENKKITKKKLNYIEKITNILIGAAKHGINFTGREPETPEKYPNKVNSHS